MKSIFSGLKSSFDQSNSVEPSNDRRHNSKDTQSSEIIDAVEVGNMSGSSAAVSSAAATFAVLSGLLRPRAAFAEETPPMQLEDDSSRTTGFPFVQAAGVDADTASNSAAASLKELADEDQSVSGPNIAMPSGRGSLRRVVNNEGSPGSTDFQVPSPTSEQARGSLSTAELTVDASVQTNGGPNVESRGGDPEDEDFDFGTLVLEPEVVAQIDNSPDVERYTGGRANEDAAVDTVVVALRATDMDGDAVKYALTDSTGNPVSNNNFEIVGNEIHVKSGAELNFESIECFDLFVTATDGVGTSEPHPVTVNIDDVAEILQLSNTGVNFTDLGVTETAILGGDGADWIVGCDVDDTFFGGDGSDILVGGSGNDTVVFTGDLSDYSVSYEAVTQVFRVTGKVGSESTDIESQFKTFTFNGKDYTAAEMETEAARQANSVLGQASVKSGGTVGENSAAGTVVAVLQATNADGDALTFELTDVGGAAVLDCNFEIVGNEVRVKTGADLDIESAESFDVFVTSSDTFKTSAPQRITLSVTDFAETIIQTAGDDTFVDSGVAQFQIEGRTGNDFLSTGTAVGGDGNDRLYGHSTGTNNEIDANNLSGRGGADLLHGADGIDLLSVRDGDDTLFGLGGDDTLEGGFGSDTMQGGDGADARMLSAS